VNPLSLFGLARSLLLRGPLRASALGLCVAATVAVTWALPVTESVALRSGLRQAVADGAHLTVEQPSVRDFDGFVAFQRQAADRVEARMAPYLTQGSVFATTGQMPVATVNDQPAGGGRLQLAAAYLDDLAAHVVVLAGSLPPDGLGGPATAVTMPQSGADQLGLRLSDRFCVGMASGTWCARLVGLWRPLREADPFWTGRPRQLAALGRFDFFELLKLQPPQGALAGRRYAADLSAVEPANAGDLGRRLRDLRAAFDTGGPLRLNVSLDAALDRYGAAQASAVVALNVLVAALIVLALCLVQLAASRVADLQAPEVALLRAHGWSPGAAWRFVFVQLCAVGLLALPAGLVGAAAVTAALGVGSGLAPATGDLVVAAVALLCALLAAVAVLAVVAWSVASLEPGKEPSAFGPAGPWWRRWNVDLPLAGLALALVLGRPARLGGLVGAAAADDLLRFLAPVLAVSILGLVALRALPAVGRLAGRGRGDLPSALSGWQLRRRPDQHAGLVFLLVLAVATVGCCALDLAAQPRVVRDIEAIHHAFETIVIAVLVSALTIALAGVSVHFQAAARARRREYATLVLNGLPAVLARRSLGIEQRVVLGYAAAVGAVLALTLAAALLGDVAGSGLQSEAGDVLSAVAWSATLPAGLVLVSWLVRRSSFRGDLLDELGQPG
jgi:hypothetical protein